MVLDQPPSGQVSSISAWAEQESHRTELETELREKPLIVTPMSRPEVIGPAQKRVGDVHRMHRSRFRAAG